MVRNNIYMVRWFIFFVALIALSRIVPHPPNFTPVLAAGVMSAVLTHKLRESILMTLLAMFVSDLYYGLHPFMIWTYSSVALASVIGHYNKNVYLSGIAASVAFFIITNFGVWASGNFYEHNLYGLYVCYVAGLPFFSNTLLGTLFYIFGIDIIIKSVDKLSGWSYNK